MDKAKLSAFIVCFNEEANVRRCLESIKWCDEIVVIDSGSTDSTLKICGEYTGKIFNKPWNGYVEQKSYGLERCSNDWVLNIDADEEVSPDLRAEIQTLLNSGELTRHKYDGYYISRVVYYLGKWWRKGGWYPEYRLRLCRKLKTTWGGVDPHEKAVVSGSTRRLAGELYHYTYKSVADQIARLNQHSTTSAINMYNNGERARLHHFVMNPVTRFVKFYILKKGFLEGFSGLLVAKIEAFYTFLKYVKLWALEREKSQHEPNQKKEV